MGIFHLAAPLKEDIPQAMMVSVIIVSLAAAGGSLDTIPQSVYPPNNCFSETASKELTTRYIHAAKHAYK